MNKKIFFNIAKIGREKMKNEKSQKYPIKSRKNTDKKLKPPKKLKTP